MSEGHGTSSSERESIVPSLTDTPGMGTGDVTSRKIPGSRQVTFASQLKESRGTLQALVEQLLLTEVSGSDSNNMISVTCLLEAQRQIMVKPWLLRVCHPFVSSVERVRR